MTKLDELLSSPFFSLSPPNVLAVIVLIQILYIFAISVYRLVLHPLSTIGGPKLAALTSWYEFYYDVWQPGRYVFKIKELHERYGPILRIAPNEVHINDLDFLETIYSTSNAHKRDKDRTQTRGLDVGMSTSGTISHDLHRLRREALQPFFSRENVAMLEPVITNQIDRLESHLEAALVSGKPINLSDLYYALARDIVFEYSFGKPSHFLDSEHEAATLRRNMTQLLQGVKISKHFHSFFQFTKLLPAVIARHFISPGVQSMRELASMIKEAIDEVLTNDENAPKTPPSTSPRKEKPSIICSLLPSPLLPPPEKSPSRLASESTMLILAGTESTAKLLTISTYHVLSSPTILSRLLASLPSSDTTSPSPSASTLLRIPYLAACIQEGNRLSFGLTGRNCRIAPLEALTYKSHTLPAGTPISTTTLAIHTNESIFPDPWTFNPDRWLDGDKGKALNRFQYGFGKGSRRCLGMELANAEVVLALARVLGGWELELWETTEKDVGFERDFQVAFPRDGSEGVKVLVKGRRCTS
ncbi:MAG: hypothetical protein Q9220_002001 [cf. Caloplaca sp. 1 TL-2023]